MVARRPPASPDAAVPAGIGELREGRLHASLKAMLAQPGDRAEVPVGRFVIDLVRADGELVEIQTGGFGPLGRKLDALLDEHRIRVVYPVPAERRIVRVDADGVVLASRRSPKRETAVAVFDRLVSFPTLLAHPNLTLEVLLLREDHIRGPEATTTRRRTRDPGERRLVEVIDRVVLASPQDVLAALPALPPEPFTTRELAALLGCGTVLAQRTVYCLRAIEVLEPAGKRGRARCTERPRALLRRRPREVEGSPLMRVPARVPKVSACAPPSPSLPPPRPCSHPARPMPGT
jgi:hypothetical protein